MAMKSTARRRTRRTALFVLCWKLYLGHAFVIRSHDNPTRMMARREMPERRRRPQWTVPSSLPFTALSVVPEAAASLIAGSLAGAIGVGVAFPFDTLKTKQIVLSQQRQMEIFLSPPKPSATPPRVSVQNGYGAATVALVPEVKVKQVNTNPNMIQVISHVLQTEGMLGFYGGVRTVMVSQAFIKSLAFAANENCHSWLLSMNEYIHLSQFHSLLLAACFAGFVTSFPVTPVERLKVVMQASPTGHYKGEADVLQRIIQAEGLQGFLTRGLGATLAREVPSYGLFFTIYGTLMNTHIAESIGPVLGPLLFGALAGMGSRVPVYPFDVVKTLVQNTVGSNEELNEDAQKSALNIAYQLYEEGGIGAFFDGVESKVIRAGVNHAVSFLVYDWVFNTLTN